MKVLKKILLFMMTLSLFLLSFKVYTGWPEKLFSENSRFQFADGVVLAQSYNYYIAGPSGGSGGRRFDDSSKIPPGNSKVFQVAIRSGKYVDGFSTVYEAADGSFSFSDWHGGSGGGAYTFDLESGESITAIAGRYGKYVDQVVFYTNRGRVSPVYGGSGGSVPFVYQAPRGCQIVGFVGQGGKYIDAIGVIYRC